MSQHLFEIVIWIGVIMASPLLYRFSYAASALLWRRIFPVSKFEIVCMDELTAERRSVTVKIPRDKGKMLAEMVDEAVRQQGREHG